MEATEELREGIRSSIREHLALLADLAMQNKYVRDVPIAGVPAELFCVWFDDIYHPESPAHRQAFTSSELVALAEFNALFDRLSSPLRDIGDLTTLQAREEWTEISVAAAKILREIPPALPNPPLQRT